MQMDDLVSGVISEATKVTQGQVSQMLDGQSQESPRVQNRQLPDYLIALPQPYNSLAKPKETSSLAKPKHGDRSSLAAPKESHSAVVGGRRGKDLVGEMRTPDPRLAYPLASSDDNSQCFTDRRVSKGSRIQQRILSDKLSSDHSEESEENYVAEYDVKRRFHEYGEEQEIRYDLMAPLPTVRGGRHIGRTDLDTSNGHVDFLKAVERDMGS